MMHAEEDGAMPARKQLRYALQAGPLCIVKHQPSAGLYFILGRLRAREPVRLMSVYEDKIK